MPRPKINAEVCKGCEVCVSVCPKKILAMSDTINASGYHTAGCTDDAECIGCAFCALMCPDSAIEVYK
ncbi:MAG: 4Fe-4S dicluster domain-containing protein [bacterium]|jgi:2-oxoglutarate ferredoxin oxidoreductase subunit delta